MLTRLQTVRILMSCSTPRVKVHNIACITNFFCLIIEEIKECEQVVREFIYNGESPTKMNEVSDI